VIKGDKIVKEVGGGMCQIGTTLFRMAMNSGMDITERRNHSLVVSYYADPVNGNPGTDATVYDQVLDLKFINDTGNYLLLETEMDTLKEELRFTLWGKSDGRSGSYTHPEVLKWIPTGPARIVETTTLAPGKKVCQGAFPGAVAKFTYTRITPTGETIERVFDSYYRALPSICTVGVEKKTEEEAICLEGETCGENNLPEENNTGIIDGDTNGNSTST
jgi:vancomycin resistance protein YoaR